LYKIEGGKSRRPFKNLSRWYLRIQHDPAFFPSWDKKLLSMNPNSHPESNPSRGAEIKRPGKMVGEMWRKKEVGEGGSPG
jgi:hypothetical protein